MVDNEFILKGFTSYPVPGMTNENEMKMNNDTLMKIFVRIFSLWAKVFDVRPHKYEKKH